MTNNDVLWRRHLVRRATSARDLRGPGWSGFRKCASDYLTDFDVDGLRFDATLGQQLDEHTDRLAATWAHEAGDAGAPAWGLARKSINVFLADAVEHHRGGLGRETTRSARPLLEIPLDRRVAEGLLRTVRPGNHWPRGEGVSFTGLRDLEAPTHAAWQALAADVADALAVDRIELGLLLQEGTIFRVDVSARPGSQRALDRLRNAQLMASS